MKNLYKRHRDKRTRPLFNELSTALHSVVTDYSRVFVIIDALEECQVSNEARGMFLSEIFNLQAKAAASLFVTSRFIPEIEKEFEKYLSLEVRASSEDVRKYLEDHISQLPLFVSRNCDL
jgi:hypothetical protein